MTFPLDASEAQSWKGSIGKLQTISEQDSDGVFRDVRALVRREDGDVADLGGQMCFGAIEYPYDSCYAFIHVARITTAGSIRSRFVDNGEEDVLWVATDEEFDLREERFLCDVTERKEAVESVDVLRCDIPECFAVDSRDEWGELDQGALEGREVYGESEVDVVRVGPVELI